MSLADKGTGRVGSKGPEVVLTSAGLKKLEEELQYLKSVKRHEVAQRIKEARELGDLTENSEYEQAKNEQAFIEGRIMTLEKALRNARIIDEDEVDPNVIGIGSTILLQDETTGATLKYTIVGSTEADPNRRKISYLSPVAQALMGHTKGDVVAINVPAGLLKYRVLDILPRDLEDSN